MEKKNRLAFVYLIIGVAFLFGWGYVQNLIWPPPPKVQVAKPGEAQALVVGGSSVAVLDIGAEQLIAEEQERQLQALVVGGSSAAARDIGAEQLIAAERIRQLPSTFGTVGGSLGALAAMPEFKALAAAERRDKLVKPVAKTSELIGMGRGEKKFHLQVLLNTRGGSIQQVVLTDFQQANREGLGVKNKDGSPKPLHLVPGVRVERKLKIREQDEVEVPEIKEGKVALDDEHVEHPSYVMYHYEKPSDSQPVDTLGNREWRVVRNEETTDGHLVEFETELGAPFYIKITKTFTLSRNDYHVGLNVSITPFERPPGVKSEEFRYQIDGPRGIPIEGEWYTPTYRTGVVGWPNTRALEEPRKVRNQMGSDPHRGTDKEPIRYAAVMVQYFASALAVDNVQAQGQNRDFIDYVRFTPQGETHKIGTNDQSFLDDMTFRCVVRPLDTSVQTNHSYVLYQGPVKVRLLKQLAGDKAVPEETVNRYRDDLNLSTLTDAHMPNWIGRFANAIFWTDLVIAFTNLIHSLLYYLSQLIPNLGICIILITIFVRGLLHPFSRRQMINAKKMQAKQEKLSPEIKKLTEQYKDDFNRLQQEKMKLYKQHGINPAAMMGGCFILLLQMPVFMGLYYALQESVFFRLESVFGDDWIPNLAAPDMLFWWTEGIPYISAPEDLGGMVYLGPYFNLLPLIAVSLMMYVQSKMMPKSDDPQVQMQQKTMKIMMILMLLFFYKSPAGLAIYFICSSVWGMIERRLIPKQFADPEDPASVGSGPRDKPKPTPAEPKGWLGKKMAGWKEKWAKVLEEAQKQQQLQREQRPNQQPGEPPGQQPQRGPGGKKKKKKR